MPGLTRGDEVARLVWASVDDQLTAALAGHGLRLEGVEAEGADRVRARLAHGDYELTVAFVLAGDVEHDAGALLEALGRPPDTWDARWRGTTDDTRDVRPAIAGPRWRMAQA